MPVNSITLVYVALAGLALYLVYFQFEAARVPRIGKKPGWIFGIAQARAEFLRASKKLITEGYAKVCGFLSSRVDDSDPLAASQYKHSAYAVQTTTTDCVIISHKYLPELRKLSESQLSSRYAHYERHMAYWTGMDTFMKSDLHSEVVHSDLNQHLSEQLSRETKGKDVTDRTIRSDDSHDRC